MQAPSFTLVFAAALLLSLAVKFWLATRQMRHVAAHRDQVPAAFAGTVTLQAHRKAADYTLAKGRFGLLATAFGTAVLLGWTLLGGLDALNALLRDARAAALRRHGLPAGAAGGLRADRRPARPAASSWYSTFRIEQRFGFNRMTLRLWLADLVKGAAGRRAHRPAAGRADPVDHGRRRAACGGCGPGAPGWPSTWLLLVLYPTVIAPLFNKFEPLADEALKARVQALMQRCGFAAKGLFVMDGSRRSAHANAYFTGLGAAKRVVFFDTLLPAPDARRGGGGAGARTGPLQAPARAQAHGGDLRLQPGRAWRCWAGWPAQIGFYAGLGVAPNLARAQRRAGAAAVHAGAAAVRLLRLAADGAASRAATSSRPTPMPAPRPTAATWPARCSSCTRTTPPR